MLFFDELKRRKVFRVAIAYIVGAWVFVQVADLVADNFNAPDWVMQMIIALLVVGLPISLILAWAFDFTPDGIVRAQDDDSSKPALSNTQTYSLLGGMFGVVAVMLYLIWPQTSPAPPTTFDNSIAVLPFSNDSGDPTNNYISDGLADALRTQLGQVSDLHVVARTSSRMFRSQSIAVTDIAEQLRVATVVEGQLSNQGEQLRVNVQIIDGHSGYLQWAHTFERRSGDLLAVQREIAGQVIKQLVPGIAEPFDVTEQVTMVPGAYELLLIANDYFNQVRAEAIVDLDKLQRAINYFRQATLVDPDSAVAFSRLGAALAYAGKMTAAGEAIRQAMLINPNISEVQYTLGVYSWRTYLPGTGEAYKRAIELNPNNVDALEAYAKWIWHQKIYDEPEEYFLRSLELDRAALNRYADLGNYYGMSGIREKTLEVADRIAAEFDGPSAYMVIARLYELVGELDVAIGWALRAQELAPEEDEIRWMLAELYARIGDFETARNYEDSSAFSLYFWERRYGEMIDLGGDLVIDHPDQIQIWYGLARAYLATEQYELAAHVLEQRGIPEHALSENRRANDQEALIMYADASRQLGRSEQAQEYARWQAEMIVLGIETGGDGTWWAHLYMACVKSILGEDETAFEHLERMVESVGMPWYPVLRDAPCFRKYENRPQYEAVVRAVEDNKQEIRERLPATLARMLEAN